MGQQLEWPVLEHAYQMAVEWAVSHGLTSGVSLCSVVVIAFSALNTLRGSRHS